MSKDKSIQLEFKSITPFAHVFSVESLRERPIRIVLKADTDQLVAIAEVNALLAVNSLTATFDVARSGRAGAKVTGEIKARVTQTCGVTLEPFDDDVHETFELKYAPTAKAHTEPRPRKTDFIKDTQDYHSRHEVQGRVIEHHMNEEDPPEDLVDGKIDLGALVMEFFALGLDPYPRKPDAELARVAEGIPNLELNAPVGVEEKVSPFSSLVKLKSNINSGD